MEPEKGFTNHPEHIATARAVLKAVRECNGKIPGKIALYYTYPSKTEGFKAERISMKDLGSRNGRDYSRIGLESWACYRSQFRIPEKLERGLNALDTGIHLLRRVDTV
jgi:LmbE family N-acetylglucosaminyl deacetylase